MNSVATVVGPESLLAGAQALQGADFQPDSDTFRFRQKVAVSIGELSVDKIMTEFEQYYPQGLPGCDSHETAFNFEKSDSGLLLLRDYQRAIWPQPIIERIEETLEETHKLLTPLLDDFEIKHGVFRVRDEKQSVILDADNEVPHVDRVVARDTTLLLVSAFPRNILSLNERDFHGKSMEIIFSDQAVNLCEEDAAAILDKDWTTVNKQARLMSMSGTIHKKPVRPITDTNRYRGLWRIELRPVKSNLSLN